MNLLRSGFLLLVLVTACSGDAPSSDLADAAPDALADAPSGDGGSCCTPSAHPGCCMAYGGYTTSPSTCAAQICDGMPLPDDPEWKLVKDAHGCDVWTNPKGTLVQGGCGSAPPPDAGALDATAE